MADKRDKPFEKFLLEEYSNIAQAHFKSIETISTFFRYYLLIMSIPLSAVAVISQITKDMSKLKRLQTEIPLKYMVFDVLRVKDNLITSKPLKERKEELKKLFENKQFKYTELLEWGDIKTIFAKAKTGDNEGIVVKNLNGVYEHRRSREWLKCKFFLEKDIVFTKYEVNPNGIRVENNEGIAVQIAGREQSEEAKQLLDKNGKIEISVQYLEETEDKKLRFPSCKKIVG